MSATVPVVALTGSLGSGKTTILNHLLAHRGQRRVGVLVNDFGAVDVDALLVDAGSAATLSLAGGCVCCRVDDDTLDSTLEQLTSPRAGLDLVLVESSGVADPATLAARLHRAVRHPGQVGGLLHVLDARAWSDDDTVLDPAALARADLVALTKTDLPGSVPVAEARRRLEPMLRTGVPVVDAPHGAVDPDLFADASAPLDDGPRQLSLAEALPLPGGHQHVHASTWEHDGLVHPRRLAELLDGGLPSAYRLKGVVRLDVPWGARWWTVHRVGGLPRVTPAPTPEPRARPETRCFPRRSARSRSADGPARPVWPWPAPDRSGQPMQKRSSGTGAKTWRRSSGGYLVDDRMGRRGKGCIT